MVNSNGSGTTCSVAGCTAKHHGRGLCRKHFDLRRYAETTGQDPEAQARQAREWAIEGELEFGPGDRGSVFADDEERRAAWEERRDQLLEEYLTPPLTPGKRPAAWWTFEAGRPRYLSEVDYDSHDLRLITRQGHEREIESITWMAANGHLTKLEIEIIERKGGEARSRIGTPAEQKAALSPDYGGDKLPAALADAVLASKANPNIGCVPDADGLVSP
jgi:hypothetical protein